MRLVAAAILLLPATAFADWSAKDCGSQPATPHYDLTTRAGYNDGVAHARDYQDAARAYAACVVKTAHTEQARISHDAQTRIADIQASAVATQQAVYARLEAQSAAFKTAAARLKK